MKYLLLTLQALLFTGMLAAQQSTAPVASVLDKRIDSLLLLLEKSKQDTNRVLLLYELGVHYNLGIQNKKTIECAAEALNLSQRLNYKRGECLAYYLLGINEQLKKNYSTLLNRQD